MNKLRHIDNYKFFDYFLPFFIIIAPYKFLTLFLNYGIIIFAFFLLYLFFLKRNIEVFVFKPILYFTTCAMLVYFFNNWRLGILSLSTFNNIIITFLMILIISIITNKLNFSRFYNVYKLIGIICCITVLAQALLLYFFNIKPLPITLLPVSSENLYIWQESNETLRPSAYFSEPQAFASFLLPLFILSIFKKDYLIMMLIIISIILSGSTLGIISIFLIGVFYFLNNSKVSNIKNLSFFLLMLSISLTLFFTLEITRDYAQKLLTTNITTDPRLLRGFTVFFNFSIIDFLIGVGDNLKNYILQNINDPFVQLYVENNIIEKLSYVTTIPGNFIKYGFILGLSYFLVLRKIYILFNSSPYLKTIAFTIIFLSFGQTILFNSWFLFYFSIIFGLIDNTESKLFSKWVIN